MILNVSIILILIIVLTVPSSANVCNFIGYACSLNNINSSYFTQLDYLHDSEIGDSWLLKNDQSLVVSGRLVSDLLSPPYGPSPHCLMLRYSVTGDALIRLIVITQSDDYEVRFCYMSDDLDGDVKKISVPFSMYSHTRITLDISMSSYGSCAFYLESFWVVRDDCYPGFKERMVQCPEYNGGLTIIATTDTPESIIEMKSLHYNLTTQVNNSSNSSETEPTVNSRMPTKIHSPTASLISNKENISSISSLTLGTNNLTSEIRRENRSKYMTIKDNVTIQLFEPLNLNKTIVQNLDGEKQIKKMEVNQVKIIATSKANSSQVKVTPDINSSTGNHSGNATEMYTENKNSKNELLNSFLPFITTESWRSEMVVSNSSNETSEFLEGKMSPSDNKTNIMDSRLVQPTQQQMFTSAQSNSSVVANNITAASIPSTEYANILDGIKEARNETKVSVKPTFNETAGVQSETGSSYVVTRSTIVVTEASVNHFTPLSTTKIKKLDFANSSSLTQVSGEDTKSTQIGNFVHGSMNYNSSSNNQFNEVTSTSMMQLGGNVSTTNYPSSEYSINGSRLANDTTQSAESTDKFQTTIPQITLLTKGIFNLNFTTKMPSTYERTFNVDVNASKVIPEPNEDKSNLTTEATYLATKREDVSTTLLTPGTPTLLQHQNKTTVMVSGAANSTVSSMEYIFSADSTHENLWATHALETNKSTTVTKTEVLNVKSQTNNEDINTTELTSGIETPLQHQNDTNVRLLVSNKSVTTAYSVTSTSMVQLGGNVSTTNNPSSEYSINGSRLANDTTQSAESTDKFQTTIPQITLLTKGIFNINFTTKMPSTYERTFNVDVNASKVISEPNEDKSNLTTEATYLATKREGVSTTLLTPGTPTLLQHQDKTTVMVSGAANSTVSSMEYIFADPTHENLSATHALETNKSTTVTKTEVLNVKSQTNNEDINTTELTSGIETPLQLQNDTDVRLVVSNTSFTTAYSADENQVKTHALQTNQTVTVTQLTSLIPGVVNYTNSTTRISAKPEYSSPAYSVTKPSETDQIGNNGTVITSRIK